MFNKYTIQDGCWKAEISPEKGANIVSLKNNGKDVLVPLLSEEQLQKTPYTQGSPILIPANRTAEGKFSFLEKDYCLPITEPATGANLHGIVHKQVFKVVSCEKDSISLFYNNTGDALPFPFEIGVNYSIGNNCFEQKYYIKNTGETKMPLTFALHTSFVEPSLFILPIDLCQEKNECNLPTGKYVPLNDQEQKYVTGSPSKGLEISGYYRACGKQAQVGEYIYSVSDNFDHWILFNGQGKRNLLCVEPQCGTVNGLNMKNGHKVLDVGETIHFWTKLQKR